MAILQYRPQSAGKIKIRKSPMENGLRNGKGTRQRCALPVDPAPLCKDGANIRVLPQQRNLILHDGGVVNIIGMIDRHQFTPRRPETAGEIVMAVNQFFKPQKADARILLRKFARNVGRRVGRGIVHHDDVEIAITL